MHPSFPNHLLGIEDLNHDHTAQIMDVAAFMERELERRSVPHTAQGSILASLFFEPSTRTRLSFEAAMYRLGGSVQSVVGNVSSLEKGESLYDTAKVISRYSDIIVMRHDRVCSVAEFAKGASVPVINAGDGSGDHPTQALLDMYTILKDHKSIEGLVIGCLGDLKYGRAVHSILKLLSRYRPHFILVSHPALALGDRLKEIIVENGSTYEITEDIEAVLPLLDVLYVTRVQQERFADPTEYERVKSVYTLTTDLLLKAKPCMSILHPLPRVTEIDLSVDSDIRAKYFDQVSCGLYVRMALLNLMLGKDI